jgi:parallel beta-helix repeat protein
MSTYTPSTHPQKKLRFVSLQLLACTALVVAIGTPAFASSLCVKPGGQAGCYSTIGAAVAAALPGSTIKVGPGTYKEDVIIGKSLSLISQSNAAIIDASGLPNGIYVDGLDHPGLSNVLVSGFTIENAKYEGILVTNASDITVKGNRVLNNDTSLNIEAATCPGQPSFETGEDFDCGEGVHIMGVSYSTIADNVIANNSGGILISDDTGRTHDNLITGNTVKDNAFDCGITLASHGPALGSTAPHNGVVDNIISNNQSIHNGFQVPGAGAGIGFFSDGSGIGLVHGNTAIGNQLLNNGIPGIAFHSHVGPNFHLPADDLNDNRIIANHISGNGADVGDTPTPGPTGINLNSGGGGTPITGTVISGNRIDNETDDIAVNTPAKVDIHFNNLLGGQTGVDNLGSGTVDATYNYWGCFSGPNSNKCSSVSGSGVTFVPFLPIPLL